MSSQIRKAAVAAVSLFFVAFGSSAFAAKTSETACFQATKKAQQKIQQELDKAGFKACIDANKLDAKVTKCGPDMDCVTKATTKAGEKTEKNSFKFAAKINKIIDAADKAISALGAGACDGNLIDTVAAGPYATDASGNVTDAGAVAANGDINTVSQECDGV